MILGIARPGFDVHQNKKSVKLADRKGGKFLKLESQN